MKIGLDLDNTLVNYESSFIAAAEFLKLDIPLATRSKTQIREFLRSYANGEFLWQQLQGLAYGRFAPNHAKLFLGVKRFLWRCKQNGHSVTVVSHKTEFGHHDTARVPLRQIASEFLKGQSLLDPGDSLIQKVIYASTREEKIKIVEREKFDWFVDDLIDIIYAVEGIQGANTILFEPTQIANQSVTKSDGSFVVLSNWQEIDALINGEWRYDEVGNIVNRLIKSSSVSISKVLVGGNSRVFRAEADNGAIVCIKIYPEDEFHDRLGSEFGATAALLELGQKYTPKPLVKDEVLGVGIYEWIDGNPVERPSRQDLISTLNFLSYLQDVRTSHLFVDTGFASAACLCGKDIERQIRNRLHQFVLPRMLYPELDQFIEKKFWPAFESLLEVAITTWPKSSEFNVPLDRSKQALSPSDFGFHNIIRRHDGSLSFIDFEYFGWDDPVKLMSDFILHQGMSLSDEQKLFWLKSALDIYGSSCVARLVVCAPLYGLIWCLIILNDFRSEIWHRRLIADYSREENKREILARQLHRAQILLESINKSYLFVEISHL
jgi:hypothetical protein